MCTAAEKIRCLDLLRDTKIRNLDAALVVNEDVGALDVSMDDIPAVEVGEASNNLSDETADEGFSESSIRVQHGSD